MVCQVGGVKGNSGADVSQQPCPVHPCSFGDVSDGGDVGPVDNVIWREVIDVD